MSTSLASLREQLSLSRCWTESTARIVQEQNIWPDCLIWNREELLLLLEWVHSQKLSSVLEIACHTGQTLWHLDRFLEVDRLAACGYASSAQWGHPLHLPTRCERFSGDITSPGFEAWRSRLGPIDLVIHHNQGSQEQMQERFELLKSFPTRHIAFHKISGNIPGSEGVKAFWEALQGQKQSWIVPNPEEGWDTSPFGIGLWSAP